MLEQKKKEYEKNYLLANKHSGSDVYFSSHTNFPWENCCFVGYSVSMDKRILQYGKCCLQDMWQKNGLMKLPKSKALNEASL